MASMSEPPLVSAVIPAYNASRFLTDAIESVLAQTYERIECIVVDDGSTDDTTERAAAYGDAIRFRRQANLGVSAARNAGAAMASGAFVAFLDADDLWETAKIERQIEVFTKDPDLGLVYTGLVVVDEQLSPLEYLPAPESPSALRNALLMEGPSMSVAQTGLIPKVIFDSVGGFDTHLSTSADTDLGCRLALSYKVAGIDEPLVRYRTHVGQMHRNPTLTERDMLRVFSKIFDDPRLDPELKRSERRAEANLYYVLGASSAIHGSYRTAVRYLAKSFFREPRRVLTRAGESLRSRRRVAALRPDWLEDRSVHAAWESAYRMEDTSAFYDQAFDWISREFRCSSVLDLGCGSGAHAVRLARRGVPVIGVDRSDAALERARERVSSEGLGHVIELIRDDVVSLSLPDRSADCVLCWGVLMHVPDLDAALTELRRVMKKDGLLIMSEVNARSVESSLIRTVNRLKDRRRVRNTNVGFEIVRSEPTAAAFTRQCNIRTLVELVEDHGFRLEARRAGQLTELYTRASSRLLRHALGRLNEWWFRSDGVPGLAVGNILVFRAD